jgi:hypothetical protein
MFVVIAQLTLIGIFAGLGAIFALFGNVILDTLAIYSAWFFHPAALILF